MLVLVAIGVAFYAGLILDSFVAIRLLGTTPGDIASAKLTWGITIGQYLSYLPVLAVLLIGVPWASRMSLHDLGLRGFDRTTVFAGLIGAVAMYAVTIGLANVQYTFTHQKPEEAAITLFTSTHDPALIVLFTFLATIAAPFMEEFVYRGFLFNALMRRGARLRLPAQWLVDRIDDQPRALQPDQRRANHAGQALLSATLSQNCRQSLIFLGNRSTLFRHDP